MTFTSGQAETRLHHFAREHGHTLDFTQLSKDNWCEATRIGFDSAEAGSIATLLNRCMTSNVQTTAMSTKLMQNDAIARYNRLYGAQCRMFENGGLTADGARREARTLLERQAPALVKARDEAVVAFKREQVQRQLDTPREQSHSRS